LAFVVIDGQMVAATRTQLTTKLGELPFEAETRYDQRDRDWTLLGIRIEFSETTPLISIARLC
jgi:hypothetical protein